MQPFPVLCETCGAKLKVRDPAAIGQIHACPKCESMVHIVAPVVASDKQPSTALPSSAPTVATDSLVAPADFATEIDRLLESPASETGQTGDGLADHPADLDEPADDSLEPATTTQQTATLIWSGAGVLACFTIGTLAAAWWMQNANNSELPAKIATNETQPTLDSQEESNPAEPGAAGSDTPAVEVNKPVVDSPNQPPPSDVVAEPTPSVEAVSPEEPILPDLPPTTTDSEDNPSQASATEAVEPDTLPPLDPLAIDSANLDLLLIPDAEKAETENASESETATAEAPQEVVSEKPDETVDIVPPARPIRFTANSASRGPTFDEAFSDGELETRLAATLPGAVWRDVPAYIAFDELAQLSGAAITVDPAALRMRGITAQQTITVVGAGKSVLSLASSMAEELRLGVESVSGGLLLVKSGADRWRDQNYNVSDLVDSSEQTQTLAGAIRKLVAPEAWNDDNATLEVEGTSLQVNQRMAVHYDLLVFCERLRVARGLSNRSKYPASLLGSEPRLAQLSGNLAGSTTFAFVDWTPLSQVLRHMQDSSDLVLLPDWMEMGKSNLRPATMVAASANDLPWDDALDTTLSPLGLAWLPIDGATLQITTQDAAQRHAWVEFYNADNPQSLRERIESQVDAPALASLYCYEDNASGLLVVRGNRSVHEAALAK